jgi:hypothetical protein
MARTWASTRSRSHTAGERRHPGYEYFSYLWSSPAWRPIRRSQRSWPSTTTTVAAYADAAAEALGLTLPPETRAGVIENLALLRRQAATFVAALDETGERPRPSSHERRRVPLEIADEVRAGRSYRPRRNRGRPGPRASDRFNAYTAVFAERALAQAEAIDADLAAGRPVGPLAGVPFAVKNLFDVEGATTRRLEDPPRRRPRRP